MRDDWFPTWDSGEGSWNGRRGCGIARIDAGKGMPKKGANIAVLPGAPGTHCSSTRKEVPCLKTDNRGGGTA